MADSTQIREHMEILGSDGEHVGTVDRLDGARMKLTRTDPAAGANTTSSMWTRWKAWKMARSA